MTTHDFGNALRALLAALALALLALSAPATFQFKAGLTLWAVGFAWTALRVLVKSGRLFADLRVGTYILPRILLAAGVVVIVAHIPAQSSGLIRIAAVGGLMLTAVEGILRKAHGYTGLQIANFPGVDLKPPSEALARIFTSSILLSTAAHGTFAALATTGVIIHGVIWLIPLLVATGAGVAVLVTALLRRGRSRSLYESLPERLETYAPKFVFYWDAPRGTAYQVGMWVPYLKRVEEPFFIMVRNPNTFNQAVSVSDGVPVVLARTMAEMDRLVPSSLTTAFYSNNGARNAHFVRYPHITHIQLLHGDSDKASSYNPITVMFDKVYVAGQAGIDRYYDHGVDIPADKFRIVGRPQVEEIVRGETSIDEIPRPVVLYAPTWRGAYSDASYSSLPIAQELFDNLLERDCTIIFRPHPYCIKDPEYRRIIAVLHEKLEQNARSTGAKHLWGEEAEIQMSVNDCFNACDVMVSDVSSVVVDFLYSEKPFALVAMGTDEDQFIEDFPLAKVAYVLTEERDTWTEALDSLLRSDPLAAERRGMRVHYLGDFPAQSYAQGFIEEARAQVRTREKTAEFTPGESTRDPRTRACCPERVLNIG